MSNDLSLTLDSAARPARSRISVLPVVLGCVLASSPLLFPFDASISVWIQGWTAEGTFIREAMTFCYLFFSWWAYIAGAIALLIVARNWRPLLAAAVTVVSSIAALHLIKLIVGRARPKVNLGAYHFDAFGSPKQGLDSFPSGHAFMSFMLALLLNRYFPGSGWFFIPAAVLTGLGRIAQDRHYPSDVVAGAALAGLCVQLGVIVFGQRWFSPAGTTRSQSGARP